MYAGLRSKPARRPSPRPGGGRILFPFVAHALSPRALDAALRLARAEEATLVPVFLARVVSDLPLEAPLPRQSGIAIPLQEAIEQRAAAFGVPVDARIERGRTYRHALRQTIANERFDRIVIAASSKERPGFDSRGRRVAARQRAGRDRRPAPRPGRARSRSWPHAGRSRGRARAARARRLIRATACSFAPCAAAHALAIFAAGIAAGTINTVVGSGTLITFPVLLGVRVPAGGRERLEHDRARPGVSLRRDRLPAGAQRPARACRAARGRLGDRR